MWEKIEVNKEVIENSLNLAKRDLSTAEKILKDNSFDWCLSIAYNAMLQAGRALMFSKGFRPKGKYKHVAVVEFVKAKFGKDFEEQTLFVFNKIRKKRHIAVYEQIDIISREEAEHAIVQARKFIKKTKEILKKK